MSLLLLQSCSNSKVETREQCPAIELYSGYFYKIIKKSIQDGELRSDMDIRILSATHGLIRPDEAISYYDQQMDTERADQLRPAVVAELRDLITEEGYNHVVVNMGAKYRSAIKNFNRGLDVKVDFIEGAGIGYKGHKLKRFVRGDDTVLGVST
jgi:cytoplasmic iron level regulating protein YaaA (DUF328/UPF0246 family)